ncbi:hypothetical protein [Flexivirga caeni]|uniref:Uncharacterized protein n=1 Tax=Flexivirga caeni TaxID=2294115 RepID=A0A3M9M654_9MICO|nr:hypothetical protein [Flexivirga caeni]RNI20655.1 hypothetical protein EFY87_13765 [Flexivirga caeni]
MDEQLTPDEAARSLAALDPVTDRSRRLVATANLNRPLIAWGCAWLVGGLALQLVRGTAGVTVALAGCAVAVAATWGIRSRTVRTGRERRIMAGWSALLVSSALFVVIAAPTDRAGPLIIPAAVWALGMLLFGIAAPDPPLAVAGGAILLIAAAGRVLLDDWVVLLVRVLGGLAMAVTGLARLRERV